MFFSFASDATKSPHCYTILEFRSSGAALRIWREDKTDKKFCQFEHTLFLSKALIFLTKGKDGGGG